MSDIAMTTILTQEEIQAMFNEDTEFPPMVSFKGKQPGSIRYMWAGYVYGRDGHTSSFRCSNRTLYDCPGRAVIKNETVRETRAHSHPREPHIVHVERVKQDMIDRAKTDKSIALRTIYLEACESEPMVKPYLGLDTMLYKMKKARRDEESTIPEHCVDSKIDELPLTKRLKLVSTDKGASTSSVHIWDSITGQPIPGLEISLYEGKDNDWSLVCEMPTTCDGKCHDLLRGKNLTASLYKLKLDTKSYYSKLEQRCFYPYIEVRRSA